jgi:GT2 family glycosyltransferase
MSDMSPFLSVIIPTYNRPRQLARFLAEMEKVTAPPGGYELILVDDGSLQDLKPVVAPHANRLPVRLLRQEPNAGVAVGRNFGVQHAEGEYVTFSDDDILPTQNWLVALEARCRRHRDCIIGGRTLNALTDNLFSTASQMIVDVAYAWHNTDASDARFFAGNNITVPRTSYLELGGFDERFGRAFAEDRDFCDRCRAKGHKLVFAPEVILYHAHTLTLGSFWRQHWTYGRGTYIFHTSLGPHGRFERFPRGKALQLYVDLLAAPFRARMGWRAWPLLALMVFSRVAYMAGFAYQQTRS